MLCHEILSWAQKRDARIEPYLGAWRVTSQVTILVPRAKGGQDPTKITVEVVRDELQDACDAVEAVLRDAVDGSYASRVPDHHEPSPTPGDRGVGEG